MLSLLADLTGATDPELRALARRLAGRLFLDIARRGPVRHRGVGQLVTAPYAPDAGDLDIDASFDEITEAAATRRALDPDRLKVRRWVQPDTALCLLVDRSGSMGGRPLATAAAAAAAVAFRAPNDYSVVSFAKQAVIVRGQDVAVPTEDVVDGVLALRGFGTTDLAGALDVAAEQLGRSGAQRRVAVLLSDCRANEPGDAAAAASRLDELVVLAPDGDDDEAREFATSVGAEISTVAGPSDIADALGRVLNHS